MLSFGDSGTTGLRGSWSTAAKIVRRTAVGCAAASVLSWAGLGASTALAADGAQLYAANCAKCHGADGKADTPVGRAMKAPALAGMTLTTEQIKAAVHDNPKHKSVASKVSDDDLSAIAKHIEALEGQG